MPGLAEKRPSILRGDTVLLTCQQLAYTPPELKARSFSIVRVEDLEPKSQHPKASCSDLRGFPKLRQLHILGSLHRGYTLFGVYGIRDTTNKRSATLIFLSRELRNRYIESE